MITYDYSTICSAFPFLFVVQPIIIYSVVSSINSCACSFVMRDNLLTLFAKVTP
eukprot:m.41977 g.41977  ORF g.41977 m.41977 type:complete len:54 (-) comp7032_c0_seq1:3951-4112(-)